MQMGCWAITPVTFSWLQWGQPVPQLWCKWQLYASLANLYMECFFRAVLPQQIQSIHHHLLLNCHHLCSHHHLLALKSLLVLRNLQIVEFLVVCLVTLVVCRVRLVFIALYVCIRTQNTTTHVHTHTHTQLDGFNHRSYFVQKYSRSRSYFVQKYSRSMWFSYFYF